jgi:hypothetical protein
MLSALLAGALILAAALILGAAVMTLAGRPRHSAVGPAAGVSALLVICGIAVKLPGHAVTAAVAVGVALIAAFVIFDRGTAPTWSVRVGAIAAVLGAALLAALPYLASGRIGILGQGLINDDWASHLLFTEWLDSHAGPTPDLIKDGYPLGPHAIVAASTKVTGASLLEGFAGLTGAIAALLALTAYGALPGVRGLLRAPAAVLVSSPYLAAAYLSQGAFKEPMLALALLGFALALPALRPLWSGATSADTNGYRSAGASDTNRYRPPLTALPLGVIAAGTIYNYSFPGLAWLLGAAVIWMLLVAWRDRNIGAPSFIARLRLRDRLRGARPALLIAIGIPVLLAIPEIFRLASFSSFEAINPQGTGPSVGFGNLRQPLNPLEAFGIWPSGEFRITPANSGTPELAFYLGGLLAVGAFAWGLGRALARRELALPSALMAAALVYLAALAFGTPYTQAKALAIGAPLIMLIALRGLLSAGSVEDEGAPAEPAAWWPPRRLRPLVGFWVPLLAIAFAGAAALSTLLPLRESAVGTDHHLQEMVRMRPLVDGQKVLFLGRDNFVSWELIGSEVYAPITNHYDTEEIPSLYRATPVNAKFDWDNVPIRPDFASSEFPAADFSNDDLALDDFDWVVTTSAAVASEAPSGFEPRLRTGDFILWNRTGSTGERRTLFEPLNPGAQLDCSDPGQASLSRLKGTATVFTKQPVLGGTWSPNPELNQSRPAEQAIYLTPGRWEISLQYASTQALQVSASGPGLATPGLEKSLRTNLLFRGPSPYYPVGTIQVARPGEITFQVSVDDPPLAGRLVGADSKAFLDEIAATPVDPARETVPLSKACDRYTDWYEVAPGTPAAALAGVPGPVPHPAAGD